MLKRIKILVLFAFVVCTSTYLSAVPVDSAKALKAVKGWLKLDPKPLNAALGGQIDKVNVYTDADSRPIYYVVALRPSGFVIVSADDKIEPVVAFAARGYFNSSPDNPLAALLSRDLPARMAAARAHSSLHKTEKRFASAKNKWTNLASSADSATLTNAASVSDIRVSPLMQTQWDQKTVCGNIFYDYYTPNNYPCGCVATAMAQLMKFHQYPAGSLTRQSFTIYIDHAAQPAFLLGGDGTGGPYIWADMPFVPDCSTTIAQSQAVGSLCYDAGVAVNMDYGFYISLAAVSRARNALVNIFGYGEAVYGYNNDADIGAGLAAMINPNLDAGFPVILGIDGTGQGHAVVADGYGRSLETIYHHLNLGWSGQDDAWYNLPIIDSNVSFNVVRDCIYNIFPAGSGEIISGRITAANGTAIAGVTVTAQNYNTKYTAHTNGQGVYAFAKVPSSKTFTISALKSGLSFADKIVTTGDSSDHNPTSGNVWAVDFVYSLPIPGDFGLDGKVDFEDFAALALAWMTRSGQNNWNATCDISSPSDNVIDLGDFTVFAANWLTAAAQAIAGDFDYDGAVGLTDFAALASAWMAHSGDNNWNQLCDISSPADNVIDFHDLAALAANWLQSL